MVEHTPGFLTPPPPSAEAVLDAVGPRLRALREQRGDTLAELSTLTGISVSTLSRLEAGKRRPTLELLLPLARAHQVPIDELVGPPEPGDPRVHGRPFTRHGRTFQPLTRRPGGLQAFKIVIPPDPSGRSMKLGTHEGYEWLYVLSGQVRLLLGGHDLVVGPGEAAEFDTRVPHAIGNPGPGEAEMLTLFGPQGERMHVRAKPPEG